MMPNSLDPYDHGPAVFQAEKRPLNVKYVNDFNAN
jgi:hypothetical protein